jgi:hypothetical protein
MKRFQREFDVLLAAVDTVQGELAREILESARIPSMIHGPDFDVAGLGSAAYGQLRHGALLAPHGARDRARAVLVGAWGEEVVRRHE